MKVKAIRAFWMEDKIRGTMIQKNNGDVFEIDPDEDGEQILTLLGSKITIVDEKFIPARGTYRAVYAFPYRTEENFQRTATAGKEITLPQEIACTLLTSGFIRRLDDSEWSPRKLLLENMKSNQPKVMFDDEGPRKESWARKGIR